MVENDPDETVVGEFTAVDAAGGGHTFSLFNGTGSSANHGFDISGNQLRLNYEAVGADGEFLDLEKQSVYSIRVRASNSADEFFEKVFVIEMLDDRTEDADGDGLGEAEEEDIHGTSDLLFDTDGDGFGDRIEFLRNSSPTDGNDWPDYPLVGWGANGNGQTTVPAAARGQVQWISAGLRHSFALRASAGFPEITSSPTVLAAPAVGLAHQIVVSNAVPSHFAALGLPAGLTLNPVSGLISGTVAGAARRSIQILVDTDHGRLSQALWLRVFQGLPPTAITLSPAAVMENSPAGTLVGTLGAIDPDVGDSHTFNVTVTGGSSDSSCLEVSGNQLRVRSGAGIDFESSHGSLTIRVRANDSALNFCEQDFVIQLTDDRTEDADRDGASQAMEEVVLFTSDSVAYDFTIADGDHDGVPALIEYAFNLNLQAPDAGHHLGGPGSTSGLPVGRPIVDAQGRRRLRMEFIRRIGSGLIYTPEFSSGLKPASWVPAAHPLQITPINGEWERCVIDDYEFTASPAVRFGRIGVSR